MSSEIARDLQPVTAASLTARITAPRQRASFILHRARERIVAAHELVPVRCSINESLARNEPSAWHVAQVLVTMNTSVLAACTVREAPVLPWSELGAAHGGFCPWTTSTLIRIRNEANQNDGRRCLRGHASEVIITL